MGQVHAKRVEDRKEDGEQIHTRRSNKADVINGALWLQDEARKEKKKRSVSLQRSPFPSRSFGHFFLFSPLLQNQSFVKRE